jgi:hypothetical protein
MADTRKVSLALISRSLLAFLILYWAAFALVTPVTVWDSHAYNIGRIPIALEGGLFGNQGWNDHRQILHPWGFDALHLPFFWLGWGASIPSYLCFIGTLSIVWRIVDVHQGPDTATLCALAMFSMPTFIYQATSTKNDWAVVFGVACWFYCLWLHRQTPRKWLPLGMACSLAFSAGAKTTGVFFLILAAPATIWILKRNRRDALQFSVGLIVALVLWGSLETYINTALVYGRPSGPTAYVEGMTNRDGVRGALANGIRYTFGAVNFGVDQRGSGFLKRACAATLRITGLHDVGYRGMPHGYDDSNFTLLKTGLETGSDFGVVGFLSFVGSACIVLRGGWRTTEWRLAASGFVCLGILCTIIAWTPWNFRFLLLPFLLFLVAFLLSVSAYFERKPWLRWLALLVILHGVFLYPIGSFNKAPRDLWASIFHRNDATFKERPGVQPVVQAVRNAVAEEHMAVLFLDASTNAWVLPFFQIKKLHVLPRPRMTEAPVPDGLLQDGQSAGLLVLNLPFSPEEEKGWRMYRRFSRSDIQLYDSALYLWRNP